MGASYAGGADIGGGVRAIKGLNNPQQLTQAVNRASQEFDRVTTEAAKILAPNKVTKQDVAQALGDGAIDQKNKTALGMRDLQVLAGQDKTGMPTYRDLNGNEFTHIVDMIAAGDLGKESLLNSGTLSEKDRVRLQNYGYFIGGRQITPKEGL